MAISKHFMCAMMKRASDRSGYIHESQIEKRIDEIRERAKEEGEKISGNYVKRYEELYAKVQEFEKASGVTISGWMAEGRPQKIGEAVRIVLSGGTKPYINCLQRMAEQTKKLHEEMEESIKKSSEEIIR